MPAGSYYTWARSRKRPARPGVIAALALGALAFALFSFVQWQQDASDASAYDAAPYCSGTTSTDCKEQLQVAVVRTYEKYYSKGRHYFVSLAGIGGSPAGNVELATGYSTWQTLTPGALLSATVWHGRIMTVITPAAVSIDTTDNPHHGSDTWRTRAIIGWVITVILAVMLGWRLVNPVEPESRYAQYVPDSASPAGFEFSHVDPTEPWSDPVAEPLGAANERRRRRLLNRG